MKRSLLVLSVVLYCIGCDRAVDAPAGVDSHSGTVAASPDGPRLQARTSENAACGRFEVSGEVDRVVDTAAASESRMAAHGGWDFSLHDDDYVVMFRNVPAELAVGEYPFATDMPSVPEDWDWETPLDFPLHVVFAERSGTAGLGMTWDDDIAGHLTVTSIEGATMTGQFVFTDGSVKVLGSFCNIGIPASQDVQG